MERGQEEYQLRDKSRIRAYRSGSNVEQTFLVLNAWVPDEESGQDPRILLREINPEPPDRKPDVLFVELPSFMRAYLSGHGVTSGDKTYVLVPPSPKELERMRVGHRGSAGVLRQRVNALLRGVKGILRPPRMLT